MRAALDYVFERMLESPEEAWYPLADIVWSYLLELRELFTDLDYIEQEFGHPSPVARFVAALVISLKKDPHHRKAR